MSMQWAGQAVALTLLSERSRRNEKRQAETALLHEQAEAGADLLLDGNGQPAFLSRVAADGVTVADHLLAELVDRALDAAARHRADGLAVGRAAERAAIAQRDRLGIGAVWLQLGVVDEAAAARAAEAGLEVVMDTCPRIEWPRVATRG